MQPATDNLSRLVNDILEIDSQAYLALESRRNGNVLARKMLENIQPDQLITRPVKNPTEAAGMLAGLWLWHDCLDEAHKIVQALDTPTGYFWHAILHRRQGDFDNSRHWYARCREHPVQITLGVQAGAIVNPLPADNTMLRLILNGWNIDAWVDLVEKVHNHPEDFRFPAVVLLQQMEWRLLFEHCSRNA